MAHGVVIDCMSKILAPLSAALALDSSSDTLDDCMMIEIASGEVRNVARTRHVSEDGMREDLFISARVRENAQLFVDDAVLIKGTRQDVRLRAHLVLEKGARAQVRQYVHIAQGAKSILASEECRVLLLDDSATVDTIPELDVQTDDAITSHAASVTRPDARVLAYLASRGCTSIQAQEIIVEAFLTYA